MAEGSLKYLNKRVYFWFLFISFIVWFLKAYLLVHVFVVLHAIVTSVHMWFLTFFSFSFTFDIFNIGGGTNSKIQIVHSVQHVPDYIPVHQYVLDYIPAHLPLFSLSFFAFGIFHIGGGTNSKIQVAHSVQYVPDYIPVHQYVLDYIPAHLFRFFRFFLLHRWFLQHWWWEQTQRSK